VPSFGIAADIHEERVTMEALRRSVAEKEALLKEVHHRVKNNLQVITSLLNLQARQVQDEKALALFDEARNRVQSIASIHEALYQSDSVAEVELAALARSVVPEVIKLYGAEDRIGVQILGDGASLDLHRALPFGLLLNELVSNVCKHAFPLGQQGELIVSLGQTDHQIVLNVRDTGVGLPKGFSDEMPSTVGIYLVQSLAQQLQANIEFETGEGTSVEVRMPMNAGPEAEEEK
jgi:two-component sensor histidine kinase